MRNLKYLPISDIPLWRERARGRWVLLAANVPYTHAIDQAGKRPGGPYEGFKTRTDNTTPRSDSSPRKCDLWVMYDPNASRADAREARAAAAVALAVAPAPEHRIKVWKETRDDLHWSWRVYCTQCHNGVETQDAWQAWELAAAHTEGPVRS